MLKLGAYIKESILSIGQLFGPYTIVRRTLNGPYLLRDDTGTMYPRLVPVDQMKVVFSHDHIQPHTHGEDEEEMVYEIDYIMDHEEEDGQNNYLVKWKGYDKDEATWEPEKNINDPQPIERYFKLQQMKNTARGEKKRQSRRN